MTKDLLLEVKSPCSVLDLTDAWLPQPSILAHAWVCVSGWLPSLQGVPLSLLLPGSVSQIDCLVPLECLCPCSYLGLCLNNLPREHSGLLKLEPWPTFITSSEVLKAFFLDICFSVVLAKTFISSALLDLWASGKWRPECLLPPTLIPSLLLYQYEGHIQWLGLLHFSIFIINCKKNETKSHVAKDGLKFTM